MKAVGATVLLVAALVSCSKDKNDGEIRLAVPAVYLQPGESVTVNFSTYNVSPAACKVSSSPDGWDDPVVSTSQQSVTVKAPEKLDDETVASGKVVLSGTGSGGTTASATLFVAVVGIEGGVEEVTLPGPANCFMVTKAGARYTFDARRAGDGTPLATDRVEVVWTTKTKLIEYFTFDGDRASFFVDKEKQGNLLLGAYDADGRLLWSWHVWIAPGFDPEATAIASNGYVIMGRNLGATSDGVKEDSEDEAADLTGSFGLYYQWGRKDPFVGASTYQAPKGSPASVYTAEGARVETGPVAADATTGTTAYTTEHPAVFLSVEKPGDDWSHEASAVRWSAVKSASDPCPYGWQVAPAAAFDALRIVEDVAAENAAALYAEKYGWTMADGEAKGFFPGSGYRTYLDGKINNIYDNIPVRNAAIDMQPWVGYYWTTDAEGAQTRTFHFWFDKSAPEKSAIRNGAPMGRANALPVRCVKVR